MSCVARTARRRRKQALMNYRHMSPLKRPRYKKTDASKSAKRLAERIAKERAMQSRKKK
jgi:hypothetical protein